MGWGGGQKARLGSGQKKMPGARPARYYSPLPGRTFFYYYFFFLLFFTYFFQHRKKHSNASSNFEPKHCIGEDVSVPS